MAGFMNMSDIPQFREEILPLRSTNEFYNYEPQENPLSYQRWENGYPVFKRYKGLTASASPGRMQGSSYYLEDEDGNLTFINDPSTPGGGLGELGWTLASALTGGISDIGRSAYNTIKNSTTRDWEKLFSGGFSELGYGYEEGDLLGGVGRWLGGVINNPLINFSDDFLTTTGTIPQRFLRDIGLMPKDVYGKNYAYTKDIAHMVGGLFAGGASSLLGGGAAATVPTGMAPLSSYAMGGNAQALAPYLAEATGATGITGISGTTPLATSVGSSLTGTLAPLSSYVMGGNAAAMVPYMLAADQSAAMNPFLVKLAEKGVEYAGKKVANAVLGSMLGASQSSNVINTAAEQTGSPYKTGGLLNLTKTPEYVSSDIKNIAPSFEKSPIPKLSQYKDDSKKKLVEILTNPYKNYTINDYALYKADPDKLQQLIDSQYLA